LRGKLQKWAESLQAGAKPRPMPLVAARSTPCVALPPYSLFFASEGPTIAQTVSFLLALAQTHVRHGEITASAAKQATDLDPRSNLARAERVVSGQCLAARDDSRWFESSSCSPCHATMVSGQFRPLPAFSDDPASDEIGRLWSYVKQHWVTSFQTASRG